VGVGYYGHRMEILPLAGGEDFMVIDAP